MKNILIITFVFLSFNTFSQGLLDKVKKNAPKVTNEIVNTYASGKIKGNSILNSVKRECQACFKNYSYIEMYEREVDLSGCSLDKGKAREIYDCVFEVKEFTIVSKTAGNILKCATIRKTKCTESKSGKHLWKTISSKEDVTPFEMEVSKHLNACSSVDELKKDIDVWTTYLASKSYLNLDLKN